MRISCVAYTVTGKLSPCQYTYKCVNEGGDVLLSSGSFPSAYPSRQAGGAEFTEYGTNFNVHHIVTSILFLDIIHRLAFI
jgi:hypothetical protein